MGQVSTTFPDSTYTSSNKPSADTLKSDISAIETAYNAHDADTDIHVTDSSALATLTGAETLTNKTIGTTNKVSFNSPEGFLINGKIVVTDAAGITVAIKGLDGNDPSASNPVYCRIGDTVRTITAALSVSKADGTNWCNAASSELETKEIDYFVYLGYNATDGVVIGFSRYPGARSYDDFSATSTNEKYCAISTISNAAATDYYNIIGRFAATLSAGPNRYWSVPTFTAKNLIQRPTYETRWLAWLPTYTCSASMSYTSVSETIVKYKISHNTLKFALRSNGTTGGSASTTIYASIPFGNTNDNQAITGYCYDTAWLMPLNATIDTNRIAIVKGSNWATAASKFINASGFYEI